MDRDVGSGRATDAGNATGLSRNGRAHSTLCRGRPEYAGPTFGLMGGRVDQLPIGTIDLEDKTFQIRVFAEPGRLVDSVRSHGIQVPLVVRPHPLEPGRYQLVCGFRRAAAAAVARLSHVPVMIRRLTDDEALILSFAENECRKTLGDLDRANTISRLRKTGKTTAVVAGLLRMSDRHVQRLEGLLAYPDELKRALGQPDTGVTVAHALLLMQALRRHGRRFDLGKWIAEVRSRRLSVSDLRRAIARSLGAGPRGEKLVRRIGSVVRVDLRAFESASAEDRDEALERLERLLRELGLDHALPTDRANAVMRRDSGRSAGAAAQTRPRRRVLDSLRASARVSRSAPEPRARIPWR